jgi:hypothetical protein
MEKERVWMLSKLSLLKFCFAVAVVGLLWTAIAFAQDSSPATIPGKIDAAVKARVDGIASYTVTEHYTLFRNDDQTHAAAEMTVKTTYKRESGKSYEILSESGSEVLRRMVLHSILDNERDINKPGVREGSFRAYPVDTHTH